MDKVDKQIIDLLSKMNEEMHQIQSNIQSIQTDMQNMKSDIQSIQTDTENMKLNIQGLNTEIKNVKLDMHQRFDKVDGKLSGIGEQFVLTNEARINDVEFIHDKVNKLEKEIFILKNKSSN